MKYWPGSCGAHSVGKAQPIQLNFSSSPINLIRFGLICLNCIRLYVQFKWILYIYKVPLTTHMGLTEPKTRTPKTTRQRRQGRKLDQNPAQNAGPVEDGNEKGRGRHYAFKQIPQAYVILPHMGQMYIRHTYRLQGVERQMGVMPACKQLSYWDVDAPCSVPCCWPWCRWESLHGSAGGRRAWRPPRTPDSASFAQTPASSAHHSHVALWRCSCSASGPWTVGGKHTHKKYMHFPKHADPSIYTYTTNIYADIQLKKTQALKY